MALAAGAPGLRGREAAPLPAGKMRRRLASMLLALAVLRAGGTGPGAQDEAARPVVMLVDVYDTTFLVGSKHRCDPACEGGASGGAGDDAECAKDLNNDDVTRFGLGQRREFGIVRDAGCPFPHLTAGPEQRIGANRVAAVVHTDFSLDVVLGKSDLKAAMADPTPLTPGCRPFHLDTTHRCAHTP